jgi:plastocyanin
MSARRLFLGFVVIACMGAGLPVTAAQDAAPAPPEGCEVLAEGLQDPMHLAVGVDGAVFVSEAAATGATGTGRVTMIAPDGNLSVLAEGLLSPTGGRDVTGPSGLAVGADGHVYVAQASPDSAGAIVRLLEDGGQEVVLDGLPQLADIAFDADGELLVIVRSDEAGEVLRCDLAAEGGAVVEVTVAMRDLYFEPEELTIPANTDVTLRVVNEGAAAHNLSVTVAGISTPVLMAGKEHDVVVNLPAGDYEIVCDVRGHKSAGMTGILHVVD